MPGSTEIHYQVVITADSERWTSTDRTMTTGDLPPAVPTFEVSGTSADGYRVFPVIGTWYGVLIVDSMGRVVWYREQTYDEKVSVQARLTVDGRYIVYNSPCHQTLADHCGSLVWVSLDGTEETQLPVHRIGHDFTQLSDGTIATIVQEAREVDGYTIWADRVIEINREGETVEIWNAWDALELPELYGDLDWTHANAINHSKEEDAYYVGLTRLSTLVKIDRTTGTQVWMMGGEESDFDFVGDSERFLTHHNFELRDDLLTLFANGDRDKEGSQIIQYEIDEDAMTVEEVWTYSSSNCPYVYALGDVSSIHGDTLHITFSTSGYLEQLEGDELTWTLNADLGYAFGYSNYYETLYP